MGVVSNNNYAIIIRKVTLSLHLCLPFLLLVCCSAMAELHMFEQNFWAENGFEELRRQMKQRSDFCKEVAAIIGERAEAEKQYAGKLVQIGKKARKAGTSCIGSVQEGWQRYCEGIETEAELHKTLYVELQQECLLPMKAFIDTKMKQRKPYEQAVDRQKKAYQDRTAEQWKTKKSAHTRCKDLEVTLEQLNSAKNVRGRPVNEKEVAKLEKSSRRNEESLIKADREYKDSNIKTEEARLAWETSMYRCCRHLENLEHQRLEQLSGMLRKYSELMLNLVTPLQEMCEEVSELGSNISATNDIDHMCTAFGTNCNQPEQLLMDCYEEDMHNQMNEERRINNLDKKISELEADIDRKEKEKIGVKTLSKAYEKTPDFADEQGMEDVTRKLIEADSMLNLLKANHLKLLKARSEISSLPSPSSPYEEFMNTRRDRQGTSTILCVPVEHISEIVDSGMERLAASPRAARTVTRKDSWDDGPSQPLETDGGQGEWDGDDNYLFDCTVVYDYEAQQEDELTITPGDTIHVMQKIDADWWEGNLNGRIGIFPANYVEEN